MNFIKQYKFLIIAGIGTLLYMKSGTSPEDTMTQAGFNKAINDFQIMINIKAQTYLDAHPNDIAGMNLFVAPDVKKIEIMKQSYSTKFGAVWPA